MLTNVIQITGLPGSGKSTIIRKVAKSYYDIYVVNYIQGFFEIQQIPKKINYLTANKKNIVILESACGLSSIPSFVIRFNQNKQILYKRFKEREGYLDIDYLSQLETIMMPSNIVVNNDKELEKELKNAIEKRRTETKSSV